MGKKLIKVINSKKAEELKKSGFNYMKENINNNTVYVFCISNELLNYMQKNFDSTDFFIESVLRF